MDHHKLVLPEHMNHYGFLFGGYLLQWIDEFAYITATVDYPGLRFVVDRVSRGTTSVRYRVRAHGLVLQEDKAAILFETTMTFVNVDPEGRKTSLPAGS